MRHKIEQALKDKGYCGDISIHAYVDEDTSCPELDMKFLYANVTLSTLSEGSKDAKAASMLVNVLSWAYANHVQTNLIVLSKKLGRRTYLYAESVFNRNYCLLLSTTRPGWYGPSETEVCFLTSLFHGSSLDSKKRKRNDLDPFSLACTNTRHSTVLQSPNMETLFPKGNRFSSRLRETRVYFNIDSFDQIPEDPMKIQDHIHSVLMKEGYFGRVSYEAIVVDELKFPKDLRLIYEDAQFFMRVNEDNDAKIYFTLMSTLLSAFNLRNVEPQSNILIISETHKLRTRQVPRCS